MQRLSRPVWRNDLCYPGRSGLIRLKNKIGDLRLLDFCRKFNPRNRYAARIVSPWENRAHLLTVILALGYISPAP